MTSQPGKQTCNNILPNISQNKSNQTMKIGQLIECNMKNVFLQISYIKCGRETIPGPFSKKWSKVSYSLFLLYAKFRAIKIYLN